MSIKGSPYVRFRRALATGNLRVVHAAAAELPQVDVADALRICLLMGAQADERYERATVRWLARVCLEVPGVRLEDLREALVAFEALPTNPAAARQVLAAVCDRLGLTDAVRALSRS